MTNKPTRVALDELCAALVEVIRVEQKEQDAAKAMASNAKTADIVQWLRDTESKLTDIQIYALYEEGHRRVKELNTAHPEN